MKSDVMMHKQILNNSKCYDTQTLKLYVVAERVNPKPLNCCFPPDFKAACRGLLSLRLRSGHWEYVVAGGKKREEIQTGAING